MPIDVKLDDSGDITVPTRIARGEDLIIQKCRGRAEMHIHEWILDSRLGVPWLEWLEEVPVPEQQIQDFLRNEFEGIVGVRRADVSLTSANYGRSWTISVIIYLDDSDAPDFRFEAIVEAEDPAVFRLVRSSQVL
jgi:hypothetical protein